MQSQYGLKMATSSYGSLRGSSGDHDWIYETCGLKVYEEVGPIPILDITKTEGWMGIDHARKGGDESQVILWSNDIDVRDDIERLVSSQREVMMLPMVCEEPSTFTGDMKKMKDLIRKGECV